MITFSTAHSTIKSFHKLYHDTLQLAKIRDHMPSDALGKLLQDLEKEVTRLEIVLRNEFEDDQEIEYLISEIKAALTELRNDETGA